jgi:hypothetical protein
MLENPGIFAEAIRKTVFWAGIPRTSAGLLALASAASLA